MAARTAHTVTGSSQPPRQQQRDTARRPCRRYGRRQASQTTHRFGGNERCGQQAQIHVGLLRTPQAMVTCAQQRAHRLARRITAAIAEATTKGTHRHAPHLEPDVLVQLRERLHLAVGVSRRLSDCRSHTRGAEPMPPTLEEAVNGMRARVRVRVSVSVSTPCFDRSAPRSSSSRSGTMAMTAAQRQQRQHARHTVTRYNTRAGV